MRLIDADAIPEKEMNYPVWVCLKKQPTIDAEPVVRCGECKHYHAETGYCDKNSHFIDSEGMSCSPAESPNWTIWDENDFCSYGERKDGVEL